MLETIQFLTIQTKWQHYSQTFGITTPLIININYVNKSPYFLFCSTCAYSSTELLHQGFKALIKTDHKAPCKDGNQLLFKKVFTIV